MSPRPQTSASKTGPRRSPRNSTMPPPSKPGPGSAKKPWQTGTRPSSGLTPQNSAGAGASKVKRSLKHSVSASVLPKQQPTSQPISFRYDLFIFPSEPGCTSPSGSDVSSIAYFQLCQIPLLLTTLTTWNKPKPVVQVDYRPSAPGRGRPRPWRREEGGGQGEPRHQARQQDQQRPGQAEEVRVFR